MTDNNNSNNNNTNNNTIPNSQSKILPVLQRGGRFPGLFDQASKGYSTLLYYVMFD